MDSRKFRLGFSDLGTDKPHTAMEMKPANPNLHRRRYICTEHNTQAIAFFSSKPPVAIQPWY